MLQITIPAVEQWDEKNEVFITTKAQTLQLEHSLVSLAKWEAKWHVPFMSTKDKTVDQIRDYVKCMTLTQNVNPEVYRFLTVENFKEINDYIEDPHTATWFSDNKKGRQNRVVTAELIYYWMTALQIPFECQKWHLNRLITLIRVCNEEQQPKKKMSKSAIMRQNAALNAARRKKYGTKG